MITTDPDACLAEMLELASIVVLAEGAAPYDAIELAEHVESLHEWLSKGGFPPKAWYERRRVS